MGTQRVVYVPGHDRWVTLGQYVRAVKDAKAHPEALYDHGLTTWWPTTGAEIVKQFRYGMNDRINQAIPYVKRGLSGEEA